MKIYGKIMVTGYSKNNQVAAFNLMMYKPYKVCICYGIHDFLLERTTIKRTKKPIPDPEIAENWLDAAKEILATNDWNTDVRIAKTYSDLSLFYKCKY